MVIPLVHDAPVTRRPILTTVLPLCLQCLACLACLMPGACFDPAIPADAAIACRSDDDCRDPLRCLAERCRRAPATAPAIDRIVLDEDGLGRVVVSEALNLVRPPANGAVAIFADAIEYRPAADFAGPDAFDVSGDDSIVTTVNVEVRPVNDAPTVTLLVERAGLLGDVAPGPLLVAEDGIGAFVVSAVDVEEGRLPPASYTVTLINTDSPGGPSPCPFTLARTIEHAFVVQARTDCEVASGELTVSVVDGAGATVVARVDVVIEPGNDTPRGQGGTYACQDGSEPQPGCRGPVLVTASATDVDDDDTALCIRWAFEGDQAPCRPLDEAVAFSAPAGEVGAFSVDYRVCDDDGACAASAVAVIVAAGERDCAAILARDPGASDGVFTIDPELDGSAIEVFCDMSTAGGGWTLVLKVDGTQPTFTYAASLWSSPTLLNAASVTPLREEAKLASFTSVPVDEVLVRFARAPLGYDGASIVVEGRRTIDGEVSRPLQASSLQSLLTRAIPIGEKAALLLTTDLPMWRTALPAVGMECGCRRLVVNFSGGGSFEGLRFGFITDDSNINGSDGDGVCGGPDAFVGVGGDRCFGNNRCSAGNNNARNGARDSCGLGTNDTWNPSFAWMLVRRSDFTDLPPINACADATVAGRWRLVAGTAVECSLLAP